MNKKIAKILDGAFWALFFIFLADVVYTAFSDLAMGYLGVYPEGFTWGTYTDQKMVLAGAALLPCIMFLCLFAISRWLSCIVHFHENERFNRIALPIIIVAFSFVLRLFIIWIMGLHTVYNSDVLEAIELASSPLPFDFEKFSSVSSWAAWPVYLKIIQNLFGDIVLPGLILNSVYYSASAGLIYAIINRRYKAKRWAILSTFVFIVWPMNLFYAVSLRPEYLCMFLILISLFLIDCAQQTNKDRTVFFAILLGGICMGISGFFKKIDIIAIIALVIIEILYMIRSKNLVKRKFVGVILFLAVYFVTVYIGYSLLDLCYVNKVNRNATAHYVEVGLSPWSDGTAHGVVSESHGVGIYRRLAREANYDYDAASRKTYEILFKDINQEKNLTFKFFQNKLRIGWSNQAFMNFISSEMSGNTMINRDVFVQQFYPFSQATYTILLLFMFLGCVFSLIYDKSEGLCFFSSLFIFGFALLMLICETQPRYKFVMSPFIAILAGRGMENLFLLGKGLPTRERHLKKDVLSESLISDRELLENSGISD